ncbi:MAG: hypothetical protein NZM26_00215 [Patescibacteria group bacterium]|nr:hypothetical protein [Patescibacteria group bacterium]
MTEVEEVPAGIAKPAPDLSFQANEQFRNEISLPIDPRDYFAIGKFQKAAESIDPEISHPWHAVRSGYFWAENSYGSIAVGETYSSSTYVPEEKRYGLLIAEKTVDGQASSVYITTLDKNQRGGVVDAINKIAPCLTDDIRHKFIREVIQLAPKLTDEDVVFEKLATKGLKLLPDYPDNFQYESDQRESDQSWPEVNGKLPTEKQIMQLIEFSKLVASKMPRETFINHMQQWHGNLRFYNDPYGSGYSSLFVEMTNWVLESRPDTPRNYELLKRGNPNEYPVVDKITRHIGSEEELKQILRNLHVEQMPDISGRHMGEELAQMVELDKVVGGSDLKTWSVSESAGRGVSNIWNIVNELKRGNGTIVAGGREPIKIIQLDGKYYIGDDGRHRIAALKALGVDKIPALVTPVI